MQARVIPQQKENELPEHGVRIDNWPKDHPPITESEIASFLTARDYFQIAQANYERRRGELLYKLLFGCELEDQGPAAGYVIKLGDDRDTIHIVDQTSIPTETIIDRR